MKTSGPQRARTAPRPVASPAVDKVAGPVTKAVDRAPAAPELQPPSAEERAPVDGGTLQDNRRMAAAAAHMRSAQVLAKLNTGEHRTVSATNFKALGSFEAADQAPVARFGGVEAGGRRVGLSPATTRRRAFRGELRSMARRLRGRNPARQANLDGMIHKMRRGRSGFKLNAQTAHTLMKGFGKTLTPDQADVAFDLLNRYGGLFKGAPPYYRAAYLNGLLKNKTFLNSAPADQKRIIGRLMRPPLVSPNNKARFKARIDKAVNRPAKSYLDMMGVWHHARQIRLKLTRAYKAARQLGVKAEPPPTTRHLVDQIGGSPDIKAAIKTMHKRADTRLAGLRERVIDKMCAPLGAALKRGGVSLRPARLKALARQLAWVGGPSSARGKLILQTLFPRKFTAVQSFLSKCGDPATYAGVFFDGATLAKGGGALSAGFSKVLGIFGAAFTISQMKDAVTNRQARSKLVGTYRAMFDLVNYMAKNGGRLPRGTVAETESALAQARGRKGRYKYNRFLLKAPFFNGYRGVLAKVLPQLAKLPPKQRLAFVRRFLASGQAVYGTGNIDKLETLTRGRALGQALTTAIQRAISG